VIDAVTICPPMSYMRGRRASFDLDDLAIELIAGAELHGGVS
jgi:hypothetical protein